MRLAFLTLLTMVAFAANSVLNRLAVGTGAADPGAFAVLRTLSGAVMLIVLVALRRAPVQVSASWAGRILVSGDALYSNRP